MKGELSPFPVSEQVLCLFLAFLYGVGLAGTSAKSYLVVLSLCTDSNGPWGPSHGGVAKTGLCDKGIQEDGSS